MSRLRVAAVGMVVAAIAVLASVSPASAHDELVSSSPSPDERLSAPPEQIALSFSADVLDMGTEVVVVDSDGADWVAGEPVVASGVVTVPLQGGMPESGYEVRWRVVSSDGHPISGLIPFTVGDAAPREQAAPAPAPAATPDVVAAPTPTDHDGLPRIVVVGAVGAVLALALFAVLLLFRRRAARGDQS